MYRQDRSKQVIVNNISVDQVTFSAVLQIGDVNEDSYPFSYGEAYGGYRGAPSFVTSEGAEPIDDRLHYANQLDEDVTDWNIYGEKLEMNRPNIRGEEGR